MKVKEFIRLFFSILKQPEEPVKEENFAGEELWWIVEARPPKSDERGGECPHCETHIGNDNVKQCPDCGVVLHDACYDDTKGGHGYQTPDCEACKNRTHWK